MESAMTALLETAAADPVVGAAAPRPLPARERLESLDVFRGITIAGMLLVNNPGTWNAVYPPLEHAEWNGWTPTDLIFPFFLFIVGITTSLSLTARRARGASERAIVTQIIRRGMLIVVIGLLLNAFPFFWWGKIAGVADPTLLQRIAWRAQHLRYAGVLQRIGLAYIAAALLSLRTTWRQQAGIIVLLLLGYWAVMTLVPVPGTNGTLGGALLDDPDSTMAAWTDRAILGTDHIWVSTKNWDPEGPLSTIPAVATAMLGVLAGSWIMKRERPLLERLTALFGAGSLAMVAGLVWNWVFPINKNLWTSSYVLFTAGMASVALATCSWLIDVHGLRAWSRPFVAFGLNPLVAFVGSGLMARIIASLVKLPYHGKPTSLQTISYDLLFAGWLPPELGSLLWGLAFVALWLVLADLLYRRNVVIKV
jgi:predicted acyltransferase